MRNFKQVSANYERIIIGKLSPDRFILLSKYADNNKLILLIMNYNNCNLSYIRLLHYENI